MLLIGGPAGAGKSTLAARWARSRPLAAHVQVDDVNDLVVSGGVRLHDVAHPDQVARWETVVGASCALARSFAERGIDVVVDDVLMPAAADDVWRPLLNGLRTRLAVILPTVEQCLRRNAARPGKQIPADLIRDQHAENTRWRPERCLDTTGEDIATSAARLARLIESEASRWPLGTMPAEGREVHIAGRQLRTMGQQDHRPQP